MAFSDLLQHRVSVYRQTNTQDATSGGTVVAWTLRTADVPCLIRGMSGQEQLMFAQQNIVVTHTIYGLDETAQSGDKVVNDRTGKTFLLTSIQIQEGVGNIDTFTFWLGREILPGEV